MIDNLMGRMRVTPSIPEIEVTPDHVKREIEEERAERRRELARIQVRALRLATEIRSRGEVDD